MTTTNHHVPQPHTRTRTRLTCGGSSSISSCSISSPVGGCSVVLPGCGASKQYSGVVALLDARRRNQFMMS